MRAPLGVLLGAILLAPGASALVVGLHDPAGPIPVTLYFHDVEGFPFPLNTQAPQSQFQGGTGSSPIAQSTCFDEAADLPPPLSQPIADWELHTWWADASPSYVEYEFIQDGRPRIHEGPLASSVQFGEGATLQWFLVAESGIGWVQSAVLPRVVVEATMRAGDVEDRTAPVLMHGRGEPATLARELTTGATWEQIGGRDVYGFSVPLAVETGTPAPREGFAVEVNAYVENPYCASGSDGDYLMPNVLQFYSGPDHWPRLEAAATPTIWIEYLHPEVGADGSIVIHASVNSPWGNYDVDEPSTYTGSRDDGVRITILDPSGKPAKGALDLVAFVQRSYEHDHTAEPVDMTYIWEPKDVQPGVYAIQLAVRNDQRTAWAIGAAGIDVENQVVYPITRGEEAYRAGESRYEGAPAPSLALVVAALALAVALRRRT